jgi:hypothetical protein
MKPFFFQYPYSAHIRQLCRYGILLLAMAAVTVSLTGCLAGCQNPVQEYDPSFAPPKVPVVSIEYSRGYDNGTTYWRSPRFTLQWVYPYNGQVVPGAYTDTKVNAALIAFRDAWDTLEADFEPRPYRLPVTGAKQIEIWRYDGSNWMFDNGGPVRLNRFWSQDKLDASKLPISGGWDTEFEERWTGLKQAESDIKAMMADLEGSSMRDRPEVRHVYERMQKFIDYEPATPGIQSFPASSAGEDAHKSFLIDSSAAPPSASTFMKHGPLYEYYMGALPKNDDFDDEEAIKNNP